MLKRFAFHLLIPRQIWMVTIQQIHRMGSFTSKPQVDSEEGQDDSVSVPEGVVGHEALLAWVRTHLTHLPSLLPRVYRKRPPVNAPRHATATPPEATFRVMQWNILAQALGTHADNFVKCPSQALEWGTRRYRILEEILTHLPQVICLQEVDHYAVLERVLSSVGYRGVFMAKPDSPCLYLPNNNGPDGCAIFWDDSRFRLVTKETRVVEVWHVQSNQVAILLVLEERTTQKQVVVLTTHLKARQGALLSSLRNEQGKDLLSFLSEHSQTRPTIVCGDFNAEPSEPVYSTMTDKSTGLESAYALLHDGKEPTYSSWKVRGEDDCCNNIDYIFYTPVSLYVEGGVDVPTEEDLGPGRAPCLSYPSDHFSLICDFTFSTVNNTDTKSDTNLIDKESNL
ncbi:nocturnin-like isoform X2 [Panulirus ornatus]|uniref:nocturnin-like isoform X2 n=1 Tax=Panulirus ornatus TaxID=150431 RepID=UPI003A8A929C